MTRELNGDQTEFTDMRLKSLQAEFGIYCDRPLTPGEYCGRGEGRWLCPALDLW